MEVAEVVKTTNKGGTALLTPFADIKLAKGFLFARISRVKCLYVGRYACMSGWQYRNLTSNANEESEAFRVCLFAYEQKGENYEQRISKNL